MQDFEVSTFTPILSNIPGSATVPVASAARPARQFRRRDADGSGRDDRAPRNNNASPLRARFDPVAKVWGPLRIGWIYLDNFVCLGNYNNLEH